MNQKVVSIKGARGTASTARKLVEANEKAIDALPWGSGTWRVQGTPGLYLRCRAQSKSYYVQRRVRGGLVKRTIGEMTLRAARAEAMRIWSSLRPKPVAGRVTLEAAFEDYIENKLHRGLPLAEKTTALYRYNLKHYLGAWRGRSLRDIGEDRAGVRALMAAVTRKHGKATANQVLRLLSAVYRWQRRVDMTLPEPPTVVVDVHHIPARDWALSPEELKRWWSHTATVNGEQVQRGVSTLGPVKKMWWLTVLFTGARKGSVEALRWDDVNLVTKVLHFRTAKGGRAYTIPLCDKLAELLAAYRERGDVIPSQWCFPSSVKDGRHIVDVRNDKDGVPAAHKLRHTYRTILAELGAAPDQARLLLGHSMGSDVSRGYVSAPLLIESLRPICNAVAVRYMDILGVVEL